MSRKFPNPDPPQNYRPAPPPPPPPPPRPVTGSFLEGLQKLKPPGYDRMMRESREREKVREGSFTGFCEQHNVTEDEKEQLIKHLALLRYQNTVDTLRDA